MFSNNVQKLQLKLNRVNDKVIKYKVNIDIMIEAKMKEQAILKLYQKYSFLNCQKTNTNTNTNNIIDLDKYELPKNIHICQDDDCCVVKKPKKKRKRLVIVGL